MPINGIIAVSATSALAHGSELANSTNPLVIAKNVTLTVAEVCLPPQVKYPVRCTVFLAMCGYSLWSPEPFSKVACISMLRSLLI